MIDRRGFQTFFSRPWSSSRVRLLALLTAVLIGPRVSAAPAYQGMSYTSFGPNVLASAGSDLSLIIMSQVGTDTVAINIWWYQDSVMSTTIGPGATSASLASVEHAIDTIHNLGMKVMLKPNVDVNDGTWRAYIDPTDPDAWFASYTDFMNTYADLAEAKGVELFSVGCELNNMEQSVNNARWTNTISSVRSHYGGPLTYAANWSPTDVGGYQNVPWWNQLDYIGIDAYFPIASQDETTLAGLTAAWQNQADIIETWRANNSLSQQVIFSEVGYASFDGTAQTPWGGEAPVDLQEQADAYEALLTVMSGRSWWDGAFWWSWEPNPYTGGANNANFTPQGKPAEQVVANHYGGQPTVFRGVHSQTLFSWETGPEGWQDSGFTSHPATVSQATVGDSDVLAIAQTGSGYSWDAGVSATDDVIYALVGAIRDDPANYALELDVIYDTSLIPQESVSWINLSIAINNNGGWSQVDGLATTNGQTDETIHVSVPLSSWTMLDQNSQWFSLFVALNSDWGAGTATVFLDNLRLVNLSVPLTGDYNGDGIVDGADYTIWRDTLGSRSNLQADGNLNGVVDSGDFELWKMHFGESLAAGSGSGGGEAVPEPATLSLGLAALAALCVGRRLKVDCGLA